MPFLMYHIWGWCNTHVIQQAVLLGCTIRLAANVIMNDKITIGQLTKGDVWPAIVPLVRFVRVSGGRVAEHEAGPVLLPWFRGHRYLACLVGRWWIRLGALCLLLHATGPMWLVVPPVLRSPWARANSTASHGSSNGCTCPQPDEGCTSYTGQPIPCHELVLAREFNSAVMPMLQQASYRKIRQAMTQFGLFASAWHVGHACPDPRKGSVTDDEDRGWNLFAQHAADNVRLGHCLVSCSEAEHTGARHIRCTRETGRCITTCEDPSVTTLES
mmetsp:Transcript_3511/g.8499  ORF Transcript_3511/g.8499 Transcript_3511/m.8499 type:complete len:272 (+) Transcript_3511:250-1065(+)